MKLGIIVLLLLSIYTITTSGTAQISVGPFEAVEDETASYERSDVTENQVGVPIEYRLTVIRDGAPLAGIRLDIWSASALGLYSDVASDNTTDQHYLRGFQFTDKNGNVTFKSIYPSNYQKRTNHVHFRLREYAIDGMNTIYDNTTQLFYPADVNAQVMALSTYSNSSTLVNSQDWFYKDENVVVLSGSADTNFTATYTIELPLVETPPNFETGIFPTTAGEQLVLPGLRDQKEVLEQLEAKNEAKKRRLRGCD